MKKVPKILQEEAMDCGAACLLSILKYYHGNMSYEKLKQKLFVSSKGTSAYHLVQIGAELGFVVEGKKGGIQDILPNEFPCIAHLKKDGYYHFVVVMDFDAKQGQIFIMDPSKGYNNVSLTYWEEICTGNYLFFTKKRFLVHEKSVSLRKILFPKHILTRKFLLMICLQQIFSFLEFFGLLETKIFFSYLLTKQDTFNILHYFLFFLLFECCINGGLFLIRWFFLKLEHQTLHMLLKRWYRFLLHLPYYYFERHEASDVYAKLELIEEIYSYLFTSLQIFFLEIPIFLFCFLFFLQMNHSFFLLLFFIFCLLCVFSYGFYCYFSSHIKKYIHYKEKRNSYFLDALGKLDFTKGFHQEKLFYQKLKEAHFFYQEETYRLSFISQEQTLFKKIWTKGMHFLFLLFFLQAYFKKQVTIYSYFLLELFYELLLDSFEKIVELLFLFPKMKVEGKKLEDIFVFEKEIFPKKSILPLPCFSTLEVKNFSYQLEGKTVLSHFSCFIKQGEKVILHGASGCGKSTLCKTIMRLFPIEKGQIYLNQFDLIEVHLEDLRNRICYVSQEEGLFRGTVLENITLGKRIFEKELQKVLELTHVQQVLKEKNIHLDFELSTLTMPFSGGERKKILLARTLLLKRDIYLLDEMFESIEEEEAKILIRNVLTYLKNKIVLVVSHRTELDSLFDQVLTLEVEK